MPQNPTETVSSTRSSRAFREMRRAMRHLVFRRSASVEENVLPSRIRNRGTSYPVDRPLCCLLSLQQTIGNQGVQRLCRGSSSQGKFRIGRLKDIHEHGAGRGADDAMPVRGAATGGKRAPSGVFLESAHLMPRSPIPVVRQSITALTTGRGDPATVQREAGSVSCRNPTGRVREIVGDDPVAIVRSADARAIQLLDRAIEGIVHARSQVTNWGTPAWPVVSDALAAAVGNRFGIDPADREVWISTRRHTPLGSPTIALLLYRLRRTREVLAGGRIRYRCLDRPPCPRMSQPGEVVLGAEAFGEYGANLIFLCEGFWRTNLTDDDRAIILVHEAFHIYFGGIDRGRNMWNAHCVDQFIADLNDIPIREDYQGACG